LPTYLEKWIWIFNRKFTKLFEQRPDDYQVVVLVIIILYNSDLLIEM